MPRCSPVAASGSGGGRRCRCRRAPRSSNRCSMIASVTPSVVSKVYLHDMGNMTRHIPAVFLLLPRCMQHFHFSIFWHLQWSRQHNTYATKYHAHSLVACPTLLLATKAMIRPAGAISSLCAKWEAGTQLIQMCGEGSAVLHTVSRRNIDDNDTHRICDPRQTKKPAC